MTLETFINIVGGIGTIAGVAAIIGLIRRNRAVPTVKSKGVRWAEKRLGHPLRQNDHQEYLVCEDELDRIVRSPFRSLFVFFASALATATFTSILRWLGS